MSPIRPPRATQKERGQRLYVDESTKFMSEMNRANDWAMANIALGTHSELKKPYLDQSYHAMEHYSAQDYWDLSMIDAFDWETWRQQLLANYRADQNALQKTFTVTITPPRVVERGENTILVDVLPYHTGLNWKWEAKTDDNYCRVIRVSKYPGIAGGYVAEVVVNIGDNAQDRFTLDVFAKSNEYSAMGSETIEVTASEVWTDSFDTDLSKWWRSGLLYGNPYLDSGYLYIEADYHPYVPEYFGVGLTYYTNQKFSRHNFDVMMKCVAPFPDIGDEALPGYDVEMHIMFPGAGTALEIHNSHAGCYITHTSAGTTWTIPNATTWLRGVADGTDLKYYYSQDDRETWTYLSYTGLPSYLNDFYYIGMRFNMSYEGTPSGPIMVDEFIIDAEAE